ncbi:class I SAM-dependent methyltransferase [Rhodoligotrophos appendicifer]|uniref:class I SAM-dependent methyltransferase n=1 Tax=Rhodoligotrophos appendicifer TaxID=987056 RepID=UPI00117DB65F|nr:50S ribosomal protein L11 methyltransferase [Rhodoligotrophos appendicifer]
MFVQSNTELLPVPHAPSIRLHLAHEALPLWTKTEEELEQIGLPPPYWAFAWAGGQALARYILDTPDIVAGRHVLDFGAGSGVVAIAAALAGAASVCAADIDAFAAAAITLNAAANDVSIRVRCEDILGLPRLPYDIILAGDICYEKPLAEKVLAWLEAYRAEGTLVLLGDPGRAYLPRDRLEKLAEYQIQVSRDLEDSEVKRTSVWRLADPAT